MANSDLKELAQRKNYILPLYFYDHSIQSISTGSFVGRAHHAEWDSGRVGYVYVSYDDIEKEYGKVTDETLIRAERLITSEVEEYDSYMRGECYGYQLYEKGELIDSCWGFIGSFRDVVKNLKGELPKEAAELLDDLEYGDDDEAA
jgi:hypothetical protein